MKGDFTRDTFDAAKHFSRVLMQQGRVTVDSDANEQTAILLHYLRTAVADLIGPYAAPSTAPGFTLTFDAGAGDLMIGAGRYYVDGILVENDAPCAYSKQPDYPLPAGDVVAAEIKAQSGKIFWAYLDVWERHVTYLQDDDIREKALNGPDTCSRSKIVWQVKALPPSSDFPRNLPGGANAQSCSAPLGTLSSISSALMQTRVLPGLKPQSPCLTDPDSKYLGDENQLYRVEIHQGGAAGTATFKWSRDNGSVASAWLGSTGNDIRVLNARGFSSGNWMELIDDTLELQGLPGTFVQVTNVQADKLAIDPATASPPAGLAWTPQLINPIVRRWDQTANQQIQLIGGVIPVTEKSATDNWIDLEDGIQIQFSAGSSYRAGDYWLIPARVATGNIEWPVAVDANNDPLLDADGNPVPAALPPDGIEHHFAPLSYFSITQNALTIGGCQCTFAPASPCFANADQKLIRPANVNRFEIAQQNVELAKDKAEVKKRQPRP